MEVSVDKGYLWLYILLACFTLQYRRLWSINMVGRFQNIKEASNVRQSLCLTMKNNLLRNHKIVYNRPIFDIFPQLLTPMTYTYK